MRNGLAERVAIITGSTQGIGSGIAQALGERGVKVVVTSRTPEDVERAVEELDGQGATATGIVSDVSDENSVQRLVEHAETVFGRIDILVNNAGINRDAMFEKMTVEQWEAVLDVNLKGPWLCCKHAAPIMRAGGYGRIINVGSEGALYGHMGMANYVAAKAGLIGLTMALARETGRWVRKEDIDFTCNLIYPGFNETRMTEGVPEHLRQRQIDQIVLGRVTDAKQDLGSVVAFLASPEASYVTGSKISVNGGIAISLGS